eukprot:SAG11_NODE_9133_length_939_cov_4.560714_1_plen_176_part_01
MGPDEACDALMNMNDGDDGLSSLPDCNTSYANLQSDRQRQVDDEEEDDTCDLDFATFKTLSTNYYGCTPPPPPTPKVVTPPPPPPPVPPPPAATGEDDVPAVTKKPPNNTCPYAHDGECDEPSYCGDGTDCSDCGNCVMMQGEIDDTCRYALDGECDEPRYCALGTDCTDCDYCGG